MIKQNISWLAAFTIIFFLILPVYAQNEDLSVVYLELDAAFSSKSADSINAILKNNQKSSNYTLYEKYTMKKTRQLIIEDDLSFAKDASLVIIDNNLENYDAVELYSYIDKAIANEVAYQAEQERQRQLAAEKQAIAEAKIRRQIQNSGSYQNVSTVSGQTIYMKDTETAAGGTNWIFTIGIADLLFQNVSDTSFTSFKYGLCVGFDFLMNTESCIIGADISGSFNMLTNNTDEKEQEYTGSFKFVPEIAFATFARHVFLRAGFAGFYMGSNNRKITGSAPTFYSPVIGVGLNRITIGKNRISAFYDFLPGTFAYDSINTAMDMGTSILVPLAKNGATEIGVKLGFSDLLLMKDEGIDNRFKAVIGIGVGNVN